MEEVYRENANLPEEPKKAMSDKRKKIALLLVFSFVSGVLGGIFGYSISGGDLKNIGPKESKTYQVEEQSAVIDAINKATPAVVSITSEGSAMGLFGAVQQTKGAGTGFIVDEGGLIVTNKHVVSDENAKYSVFTSDGKEYQAEVKARDPLNDIAFVKINAKGLPVADLGDSDSLKVGQSVIAIGNALGQYQNTVTTGIVSGVGRAIEAGDSSGGSVETLENIVQTDAAINPGNSGGPLVNIAGQVIGVNTAIDQSGQLIGFAIPINMVKKQIDSVKKTGKISRPILGIRYVPITKEFAARNNLKTEKGVLVYGGGDLAVIPDSPAAKAGIKDGDIILKIGADDVDSTHSITGLLQKYSPGDKVTLTILRDGKEGKIEVTLGSSGS
ncbi:PDZ domain-containing protein [candidate division WS5 bacterium]|uniref:PDZ domain-containing protein n=1 Tax=candidate division WS5 bacterium TaxID=2093353 RepID=A0A419DEB2_9BACT|nr:MAG: PDZ domain-containing protein [candidate division WS5 bacterium]